MGHYSASVKLQKIFGAIVDHVSDAENAVIALFSTPGL